MAKKRKTTSKSQVARKPQAVSLFDPSSFKSFFNSAAGRQLMADMVMAAAGVAAAALLASNRGGKAMGKAAMEKAEEVVVGIVSGALIGKR